jgi:hypothetical protein
MYGSSLIMLIERPRASKMAPRQAEVIPFPSEETTPPVMKTYDVMGKTCTITGGNNKGLDQSTVMA